MGFTCSAQERLKLTLMGLGEVVSYRDRGNRVIRGDAKFPCWYRRLEVLFGMCTPGSVSYTHLDVYKRQIINTLEMKS